MEEIIDVEIGTQATLGRYNCWIYKFLPLPTIGPKAIDSPRLSCFFMLIAVDVRQMPAQWSRNE